MRSVLSNPANTLAVANRRSAGERFKRSQLRPSLYTSLLQRFRSSVSTTLLPRSFVLANEESYVAVKARSDHCFVLFLSWHRIEINTRVESPRHFSAFFAWIGLCRTNRHDVLLAAQASHTCARSSDGALFAQFSRADFQASNGR